MVFRVTRNFENLECIGLFNNIAFDDILDRVVMDCDTIYVPK